MIFLRFVLCLLVLLAPMPVQAEAPPVPTTKKSLKDIEKNLAEKESEKKLLAKQMKALEAQLGETKNDLVGVANSVQQNQAELTKLETRIAENEKQQSVLQDSLENDRAKIAGLILALERIRRVPPEALIVRPGAPLQTAQSAMLMGNIIPTLHRNADALKVKIAALNEISDQLKTDHGKVVETSENLKTEEEKLSSLVKKREDLFSETQSDYKEQEKAAQSIALQAKSLKDLLNKLDAERAAQQSREQRERMASVPGSGLVGRPTPMPKSGLARLPVPGIIKTGYNDTDTIGAASKGISIEARERALVVAPFGGIVRFAGPFKRYGNMVIIEHEGGYHSLIAGLEKIDTVVGQSVSAGEPLGVLPSGGGTKPELYYELRQDGQPVDPSVKIAGLG